MFKTLYLSIWLLFHPVHVTLTSIDYMPASDMFKVFVRLYFDDFLRDYKLIDDKFISGDFSDTSPSSVGIMEKYIDFSDTSPSSVGIMEKYISERIIIKVNEKHISGRICDMKLIDNEISMNLEYKAVKKPKIITVKNLILTGLYSDQSNMIIVKIYNFEEGVRLTPELTEKTFNLK